MNREIKFRAKDKHTGQWCFGGIAWLDGNHPRKWYITVTKDTEKGKSTLGKIRVTPDSISEFTGLLDVNGEFIFEGDTIQFYLSHEDRGQIITSKVEFHNFAWRLNMIWILTEIYEPKVISKKDENSELLTSNKLG